MTDVSLLFLVHEIVVEVRVKEEGLQKVLRRYLSSVYSIIYAQISSNNEPRPSSAHESTHLVHFDSIPDPAANAALKPHEDCNRTSPTSS